MNKSEIVDPRDTVANLMEITKELKLVDDSNDDAMPCGSLYGEDVLFENSGHPQQEVRDPDDRLVKVDVEFIPFLEFLWAQGFSTCGSCVDLAKTPPSQPRQAYIDFSSAADMEAFLHLAVSRVGDESGIAVQIEGSESETGPGWYIVCGRELLCEDDDDATVKLPYEFGFSYAVRFPWSDLLRLFGPEVAGHTGEQGQHA